MPTGTINISKSANLTIVDDATISDTFDLSLGGVWGRILDFKVTLFNLNHTFPDDLDFLLVSPLGANFEFWSDAGGATDIANHAFTISDSAASALPDDAAIPSGTYRPADYGAVEDSSNWGLAPGLIINHPGTTTLNSVFGNAFTGGNWSLYIRDDASADVGSLSNWGFQITYTLIVKPDEFNGDNFSDILWQNSDGTPAMWLMQGTSFTSIGLAGPLAPWPFNPGPSWHIKDSGDFNGDGRSDILWQNSDGTPAIWLMNGLTAQMTGAAGPFNPGPSWQIKATGDFNFDTKSDILWQNSDGMPAIWLMDGFNAPSIGAVGPFNPGPSWQIKATGDFNNDGRSDILWQNSDGTPAIWLMNGMSFVSSGVAGSFNPGPSWDIKGTADFNGDGISDILWQGADGSPAIWLMNGFNAVTVGAVGPFNPGPSWHVQGTGDYNGDAKSDILWQHDGGTPAIWLMDGMNFLLGRAAGSFNPGSDWHVIA